jgi:hypothetical protein
MLSRRGFLITTASILKQTSGRAANVSSMGSSTAPNSNVIVNFGAGFYTLFGGAYLNLAKWLQPASSDVGWLGQFSNPDGYPSGHFNAGLSSLMPWDPAFCDRYQLSWSGQGGFGFASGLPLIVYSGASALGVAVEGVSPADSGEVLFNVSVRATSGCSIDFAFGGLISAVSVSRPSDHGGAGFVKFTLRKPNAGANFSDGMRIRLNNLTGLPPGPHPGGVWSIFKIDNNNFSLRGSEAFAGLISINTSRIVGVSTEAICAGQGGVSLLRGNYRGFDDLILCKKIDLIDIQDGKLASQLIVDAFAATKASYIRFMDMIGVGNVHGVSSFADRTRPSSFIWGPITCPRGYWGGQLANSADAFTCANPASSPPSGAYLDGEVVVAQVSGSGQNITQNPTLQITGRTGAAVAPIYDFCGSFLNLTLSGSLPMSGTTISLVFVGGGLASAFTYRYVTSTLVAGPGGRLDTSFANIASNMLADINGNVRGNSGPLVAANISALGQSLVDFSAFLSFCYNRNINSSGAAQLNAGISLSASDNGRGTSYTVGVVPVGYLANSSHVAFTYSALLGGWLSTPYGANGISAQIGGVRGGPPLEYYEELCTRANAGLWYNFGVTTSSSVIYETVLHVARSGVKALVCEFSNETWNSSLTQWRLCQNLGACLGLFSSGFNSLTGLRLIQMAQQAVRAWSDAGRPRSQLKIANAYQFVDMNSSGTTPTSIYRFNGRELDASKNAANVTLKAYGGPADGKSAPTALDSNHSIAPNRPIDWSDWVSPAPYWLGGQYNSGNGGHNISNGAQLSAYDGSLLAAYNYSYGTSAQRQAALDFLFNGNMDSPSGDLYDGSLNGASNMDCQIASWSISSRSRAKSYFGIGAVAAQHDSSRARSGTSGGAQIRLGVACYEGGWSMGPIVGTGDPSSVAHDLISLGYKDGYSSSLPGAAAGGPTGSSDTAATAANNLAGLLIAWKNDVRSFLLVSLSFNQFKAAINAGVTRDALPAWYGFQGPSDFALYSGFASEAVPFQAVRAIAAFE